MKRTTKRPETFFDEDFHKNKQTFGSMFNNFKKFKLSNVDIFIHWNSVQTWSLIAVSLFAAFAFAALLRFSVLLKP
jgi:hypothetical protein